METKAHVTWSPDARAALLRDESGEIVGTTWGGMVCWFPRRPRGFAAVEKESGDETILRCGFCAGCRELERQWLCARLCEIYQTVKEELWLIIVEAPQSARGSIYRSLSRRKSGKIEPASYLLGSNSCVYLKRGIKPQVPWSLARRYKVAVHRVRVSRGKRAWALLTAGMLKPRDDYGAWRNRYYHRGLPPRDRQFHFVVEHRGGISRRHQTSRYARSWRDGVSIDPPVAWSLPRLNRRKGLERLRPASAATVEEIVASMFDRAVGDVMAASFNYRGARSAPASLNDRISNRGRAPRSMLPITPQHERAHVPQDALDRHLNPIKGSGYRGSIQSGKADFAGWAGRMAEIARKRGRSDDG